MSKKFTLRKKIMSCISALAFLGTANLSSNISWAMEQPPAQPLPCNDINTYKNFLNQKLGGNHGILTTGNIENLTNDAVFIRNAAQNLYAYAQSKGNNPEESIKEGVHVLPLPCGALITRDGRPLMLKPGDYASPMFILEGQGSIVVPAYDEEGKAQLPVKGENDSPASPKYTWIPLNFSPLPFLTNNFPGCYVDQQGKAFASNGTKLVWNEDSSDILEDGEDGGNGVQVEIKYPDLFGIPVKTPQPAGDQPNQPPTKKEQPVEKKEEKKEENANKWSTRKKVFVVGGITTGVVAAVVVTGVTVNAVRQRRQNNIPKGTVIPRTNQYDRKSGPSTASTGKTTQTSDVSKRTANRSSRAGTKGNLQRRVGLLTKKNGTNGKTRARNVRAGRRIH